MILGAEMISKEMISKEMIENELLTKPTMPQYRETAIIPGCVQICHICAGLFTARRYV